MIAAIADTHAIIWFLADEPRLSQSARNFMDAAAHSGKLIGISSITLVEIIYLLERNRFPATMLERLVEVLSGPDSPFEEIPVDLNVALAMRKVSSKQIPDLPDRIIAATALHHQVPLISRDAKIQASDLETLW